VRKQILVWSVIAVIIIAVLFALFFIRQGEKKEPKGPIKIAASTWPGWSHVFLAKEKGFFQKNNVNVEVIHIHEHIDA